MFITIIVIIIIIIIYIKMSDKVKTMLQYSGLTVNLLWIVLIRKLNAVIGNKQLFRRRE